MSSMSLEAERTLSSPLNRIRADLVGALREQGYKIGVEQTTLIEAQRGSQVAAAVNQAKVPVSATIRFSPVGDAWSVHVLLQDRWLSPVGKVWGFNGAYERVFRETQTRLDQVLGALDPSAAQTFGPAAFRSATGEVALLERANDATGRATAAAAGRATHGLEGPAGPKAPKEWRSVHGLRFDGPTGSAVLDLEQTQARLTVAVMVASQPRSMPPNLAAQVERFAAKVEAVLAHAAATSIRIPVSEQERPVFEFLDQQARIRQKLPLRTLHICQACRFEKVTNPDYQRLAERNRKLRGLGGAVGATISLTGASVNPFILVGKFFQLKKLDPDFVCPRCQGMQSDDYIITFCPQCGAQHREAALRTCRCGHDFRTDIDTLEIWQTLPEEPEDVPVDPTIRFTHAGYRYLLGTAPANYAIWDRTNPGPPVEVFPLTPEGWQAAWSRFVSAEPNAVAVAPV